LVAASGVVPGASALTPMELRASFTGVISQDIGSRYSRSNDCGPSAVVFTPKTPQVRVLATMHDITPGHAAQVCTGFVSKHTETPLSAASPWRQIT
jgi:hypothetical protein